MPNSNPQPLDTPRGRGTITDPVALAVSPKIVKAKGCSSVVDLADPRQVVSGIAIGRIVGTLEPLVVPLRS